MIELVTGDLFTSHVDVLVNPTNARGVSGKGLALVFAQKYPGLAHGYKNFCQDYFRSKEKWPIGLCYMQELPKSEPWKAVVCLPTKDDYRYASRPEYIRDGLMDLVQLMQRRGYSSVAMPALGCGLGLLSMSDVKPIVDRVFFGTGLRVLLYAGQGDSPAVHRTPAETREAAPKGDGFQPVRPAIAGRA